MRLCTLPLTECVGHILRHNLADPQGHKAFTKGHIVQLDDVPRLRALGLHELRVAVLDPEDVHENAAAERLAAAVIGAGIEATRPYGGRVNLLATYAGPLLLNESALLAINDLDGLTLATRRAYTLVQPGQPVATIKVIPFAVPAAHLRRAEVLAQTNPPILAVRPLLVRRVGVILVGSSAARPRLEQSVYPAIVARVTALAAEVVAVRVVELDEPAIAEAITTMQAEAVGLIIIAGETSIMDLDDVTPHGIRLAGGTIEHHGAPVEPGNLLLMAYLETGAGRPLPILGAPGCVRSRATNIVDLLLPRLMAGEFVSRRDINALGHGGYLG